MYSILLIKNIKIYVNIKNKEVALFIKFILIYAPRSSLVASSVLVGHARDLVLKLGVKYRLVSFSPFSSRHSFDYPKKKFVVRIAILSSYIEFEEFYATGDL